MKVAEPFLSLSPDRDGIYVTIPIEEGEKYNRHRRGLG